MLLTDRQIKSAKPKAKPYKISDGEGLYLFVQPTGSKLWRMKYRYLGGENTLAIGKYPHISLLEARDHRYEAKKLLRANIDPNSKKKEAKKASLFDTNNTFLAVAEDWFKTNYKKWTPGSANDIWRRLELHALPQLGNRPIGQIKTPELVKLVRKVGRNGKLETASRLIRTIYAVFRHAVHCGILEYNPATDLKGVVVAPQVKHFAAIPVTELPEFLRRLETVNTTFQNRLAVKLLLHSFVRPGELRFGKWDEINFEQKLWTIPPERMKKRRPHLVPLSESALWLLRQLQQLTGYSDYLFPSQQRQKHPVMSENTINKVLQNMGYKGKQVGHGFRAIASTVLNESGLFRPDVIEVQLAHIEGNSSRRPYNRADYLEERREMMRWWSNFLDSAGKAADV